jgi:hypothetical protein
MARRKQQKARRLSASEERAIQSVWTNPVFRAMHVEEKQTWLYLLTGPHTAIDAPGLFRLTEDELYEGVDLVVHDGDLSERELVEQYVARFVELGWLKVDEKAGVMRIRAVNADIDDIDALKALDAFPDSPLVDEYFLDCHPDVMVAEYYRQMADETTDNT